MNKNNLILMMFLFTALESLSQEYKSNISLLNNKYKVDVENNLVRISDLLFITHGWQGNTTDDLQWNSYSNGLNITQQAQLGVLINGQKMYAGFIGNNNLNILPLDLYIIDSVEIIDIPQISLGEFVNTGRVNLSTKPLKQGLSIMAGQISSNEVGDWGPFIYLNGGFNLDRPIADKYITLVYNNKKWSNRLSYYKKTQITYSDPLIEERISNSLNKEGKNWNVTKGIDYSSSYSSDMMKLDFSIRYFYSSRYFYYSKPLGIELPLGLNWMNTALTGSIKLNNQLQLNHSNTFSFKKASIFNDANENFKFDWNDKILASKVWLSSHNANRKIDYGIKIEQINANSEQGIDNTSILLSSLFGDYEFKATQNTTQKIGVSSLLSAGKVAFKTSFANTTQLNKSQQLLISIAYYENLFVENYESDWFWINQGWDILSDYGRSYRKDSPFQKSKSFTSDVIWENTFARNATLKLGVNMRSLNDVFFHRFESDSSLVVITNQGTVSINTFGKLTFPISNTITNEINIRTQSAVQGDKELREEVEKVPKLFMSYSINFKPVKSFSLSAWVRYSSATSWNSAQCNFCSEKPADVNIPYVLSIDFSANKWLWNQRILLSVLIRNLSNNYNRYNPKGVKNDLTMYLNLSANLNQGIIQGLSKKRHSR